MGRSENDVDYSHANATPCSVLTFFHHKHHHYIYAVSVLISFLFSIHFQEKNHHSKYHFQKLKQIHIDAKPNCAFPINDGAG